MIDMFVILWVGMEKPTKEELYKLYWVEGKSLPELARLFKKHYTTVRDWLIKYNIPRRRKGQRIDSWSDDELKILLNNLDKPVRELVKLLPQRTPQAIYTKLKKLKIEKRLLVARKDYEKVFEIDEVSKAYIAGLVDGEGWISINKNGKGFLHVYVGISNTSPELIQWLRNKLPESKLGAYEGERKGWRRRYYVSFHGFKAGAFLKMVLPYLILKKKHALLALRFLESRLYKSKFGAYSKEEYEIYEMMKKLNVKGSTRN